MDKNQEKRCRKCGFSANSATAVECEICGYRFRSMISRIRLRPVLLLALVGGGISVWRAQTGSTRHSQSPENSISTSSVPPKPYTQSHNSMRDVQNVPAGIFRYGGALSFAPLRSGLMIKAIAEAQPQFQLYYIDPLNARPNSTMGITMLINGQISFAQTARSLTDTEASSCQARGFIIKQVPVSIDGLVLFTNSDVPLRGISLNQMQAVFTGQVTNWRQVGGPDLPIAPFNHDPEVTHDATFLLQGLPHKQFGPNVKAVRDITQSIRMVALTPGGIGYAPAVTAAGQRTVHYLGLAKGQTSDYVLPYTADGRINKDAFRNGTYPITRRLFVMIRQDKTQDELAGDAYAKLLLSDEGQRIIDKVGYVPLRVINP